MQRSAHDLITRGVIGGLLAGLVVALWFLVVDTLAGQPLRTPALLAGALVGSAAAAPTLPGVAAYSAIHFTVFAALGVAGAWAVARLQLTPRVVHGVAFGLAVQDLVFYGGLLLSGARLTVVVAWPHVILANVLSGIVLMAYLHRATRDQHPFGLAALRGHPLVARGLVVGLIGAAVVAAWFFAVDAVAGRPFRTPGALGSALLLGAANVAEVDVSFGVVALYTAVHVAAFAVAGVVFVAVAEQIERAPAMLLLVALGAIVLEALVVAVLSLGAQWTLGALGVFSVLGANALAVAAMGWQVWRTHPVLRRTVGRADLEVRV
jgi:hypothetical protein